MVWNCCPKQKFKEVIVMCKMKFNDLIQSGFLEKLIRKSSPYFYYNKKIMEI